MYKDKKALYKIEKNNKQKFWQEKLLFIKKNQLLKKKIIKNIFLQNIKLNILNRFLILIIKQEPKNSYVNIITMGGQVIYEKHTGLLFKNSLRKTEYALNALLKATIFFVLKLNFKLKNLFLIIKGNYSTRGLKKKLTNCLKKKIIFNKIIIRPLIAHNGVRGKKQRRK